MAEENGKILSLHKRADTRIINEVRNNPGVTVAYLVSKYGFDALTRLVSEHKIVIEDEVVREAGDTDAFIAEGKHLIKTVDEEGNLDVVDVTPIKNFEKVLNCRLKDQDWSNHESEYVTFFRKLTKKQLMFLAVMLTNLAQRYGYLWAGDSREKAAMWGIQIPFPAEKLLEIGSKLEQRNQDICHAFRMLNLGNEQGIDLTVDDKRLADIQTPPLTPRTFEQLQKDALEQATKEAERGPPPDPGDLIREQCEHECRNDPIGPSEALADVDRREAEFWEFWKRKTKENCYHTPEQLKCEHGTPMDQECIECFSGDDDV